MTTIAIVGQTPPPWHGQAIMIQRLLQGKYNDAHLVHVRMAFSKTSAEAGRFRCSKLYELLRVLTGMVAARFLKHATILYYAPAGPELVPVLRDICLLVPTRWIFRKTVFHFHSGGLESVYDRLPSVGRFFFRMAYFRPNVAIRIAAGNPEDTAFLRPEIEFVVPNGIPDEAGPVLPFRVPTTPPTILYVGNIREDRGILFFLKACTLLVRRGVSFRALFVGEFLSTEFRTMVMSYVHENNLTSYIDFRGVLIGPAKSDAYLESDIFCFPTFVASETFGVVLIEAMSFGLPIVSTKWRSVPEVVDEDCALLVPIRDECALAESLQFLIQTPQARRRMGAAARSRFLSRYTEEQFVRSLNKVFDSI